jgi:hypothetical protein
VKSSRPSGTWTTTLRGILWPPAAPLAAADDPDRTFWRAACVAAVVPLVAALHHLIFQPPTCMLNNFGDDYTLRITADWLRRDASLPWGIVLGVVAYALGRDRHWIRILVTPAFISFFLFSLWIWDIPFTGRIVCRSFHDARLVLGGVVVRTKHLYLVGAVPYVAFVLNEWVAQRKRRA